MDVKDINLGDSPGVRSPRDLTYLIEGWEEEGQLNTTISHVLFQEPHTV